MAGRSSRYMKQISSLLRQCDSLCPAGALYISGVDSDADCARERACRWSRFAAVVRSTCTGAERATLRVLCTSSTTPSLSTQSSSQPSAAPHCVSIVISPQPASASAASNIELCVRWVALVIRESRASNASCLGVLLAYISSMMRLAKSSMANHARAQPSRTASDVHRIAPTDGGSAASLASRCGATVRILVRQRVTAPPARESLQPCAPLCRAGT